MESKQQTLWIVSELFPPDETSTAYIMGEIANSMTSKYDVKVICGPDIYDKRKKPNPNNKFKLDDNIQVFRVNTIPLNKYSIFGKIVSFIFISWKLTQMVKQKVKSRDKVLMVTNPAPMIPLMARLKNSIDFELSILVHDVFPENTKSAGIKIPFLKYVKKIFDKAYAKADKLIVLGRDMAKVMSDKVRNRKNDHIPTITIIENWADTKNITPQPFPSGKIKLQYAGNIGRVQGLDKIINCIPDDMELHIYGTGAMEDKLKKLKARNVFFHGAYYRSEQNNILGSCDIAIVTLEKDMYGLGVPSKAYNILASGRPILYFGPKNSEIDLLVKENNIGYSDWPDSIDRDTLAKKGNMARHLAETLYSKEIILNKLLNTI